jgi:hypothetical protein
MKLSVLLSDALTTYESQSWVWSGDMTSIPYHVNKLSENPDTLVSTLTDILQRYFGRYLPNECIVGVEHNATVENTRYTITVMIHAVIDGQPYTVSDSLEIDGSAIKQTIDAFNGD